MHEAKACRAVLILCYESVSSFLLSTEADNEVVKDLCKTVSTERRVEMQTSLPGRGNHVVNL